LPRGDRRHRVPALVARSGRDRRRHRDRGYPHAEVLRPPPPAVKAYRTIQDVRTVWEANMWDPTTYLRYGDERGRPFGELLGRIGAATSPAVEVVDLGCGQGT